jgi:hypothetical protein
VAGFGTTVLKQTFEHWPTDEIELQVLYAEDACMARPEYVGQAAGVKPLEPA